MAFAGIILEIQIFPLDPHITLRWASKFQHQNKCNKGCVTLCDLAIYILKSILRQKKNYGNSNISPGKNINFKKSSKILQDIINL